MGKRVLLTLLLIIVYASATFCRLIATPINLLASIGSANVTITCSSDRGSNSITWFHMPAGESANVTIASGSQVYPAFTNLYWITQPLTSQSNLIIRRTSNSTAGTFTCADNEMLARAQLILWHSDIQSNNASGYLIIGDVFKYTFQVVYLGNPFFYPVFDVKRKSDNIYASITSSQLENLNSMITTTATYYETPSCLDSENVQYGIGFGQPVGNLLPGSATNAPTGGPGFGFLVAKVSCNLTIAGAVSGAVLYSGSTLTCQLTSKLPVNYSWTDLTYGNSSIGPQLTIWHGGSYNCTASFDINGRWQSVTTTVYNLTVKTSGRLITTPLNQFAWVGATNVTMKCSSPRGSNSITWYHTPVGESGNVTIASGSQVYPAFTQLYWIDQPTINQSNLIIRTPNDSTAGTFTCSDNETLARAQLIIWKNNYVSTNGSGSLIIGDVIRYTFQVVYRGNPFFYPTCYLFRQSDRVFIGNITSSQLENLNSIITATATFYETASCLSSSSMQFNVGFGQPVGNLLPGSATNAPYNGPGTGFSVAKVSCNLTITGAVSGAVLKSGATLTCQLTSKLPVNYKWTDLTYGNSSTGPQLAIWHSGSYNCTASFDVNGQWQSVSTTIYNLTLQTSGRLITTPLNQYAWVGQNDVTMKCSSTRGSNSITWYHTPVGESGNVTIASGSQVYPALTQLYRIDQSTINQSNLIIRTANDSTAGTFTCSDSERLARAQLIIWRNNFASIDGSGNFIIGDVIRYTFQVVYRGNPFFYPIFHLYRHYNSMFIANITSSQLENLNSMITSTVTFNETASCIPSQYMSVFVGFGQPVGNLLPGSATNAPDNGPGTHFSLAKVSCNVTITGAVSGAVLNSGSMLTCQLTSKLPVNYKWTDLTYGNSSTGSQLAIWHGGSYNCTASFEISGQWQSVFKAVYNLTVESRPA